MLMLVQGAALFCLLRCSSATGSLLLLLLLLLLSLSLQLLLLLLHLLLLLLLLRLQQLLRYNKGMTPPLRIPVEYAPGCCCCCCCSWLRRPQQQQQQQAGGREGRDPTKCLRCC